jgi:DHA2 family multidrug resistance protein
MVVGMFMAILDIQIVASSLGDIQGGLAAAPDEIAWVQTSYLIAEVVMIPLSGFLARLLSTRVLFVLSAAGFTLASAACAAADGLGAMILARTVQGFFGGAMIPTVFATGYLIFPPGRQGTMSVIVGVVATLAPTVGPTLGGWLTTSFSWQWLFLVNIVPGAVVTAGVWSLLDVDRPDRSLLRGFDLAGLVAMAAFLGGLQYVLDEGPDRDWLADGTVRLVALAMLAGAAAFFWRVSTHYNPIVDLRCFRDRNFALGSLFSFVLGVGLYGSVFLLPLFLGRVRHYSALDIGWVMAVTGMAQLAAAPVASRLAERLDHRLMLVVGMALFGLGSWLNGFLTSESGFDELALPQAVRGAAMLFCFIPINRLALGTLPPAELRNASGVFNLTRNLGGAVGWPCSAPSSTAARRCTGAALGRPDQPGEPRGRGGPRRAGRPVRGPPAGGRPAGGAQGAGAGGATRGAGPHLQRRLPGRGPPLRGSTLPDAADPAAAGGDAQSRGLNASPATTPTARLAVSSVSALMLTCSGAVGGRPNAAAWSAARSTRSSNHRPSGASGPRRTRILPAPRR